jgi:hypothetical protein
MSFHRLGFSCCILVSPYPSPNPKYQLQIPETPPPTHILPYALHYQLKVPQNLLRPSSLTQNLTLLRQFSPSTLQIPNNPLCHPHQFIYLLPLPPQNLKQTRILTLRSLKLSIELTLLTPIQRGQMRINQRRRRKRVRPTLSLALPSR